MQVEKQQLRYSWKISVHAKYKNFNFRLKATKISPNWKIHRFSILLKLHKFLLRLKSDSATPQFPRQQRRTLKSRFLGAVEKLRSHRAKKQTASVPAKGKSPKPPHPEVKSSINRFKHFAYDEPVGRCSLVVGILAFLFQSIFQKGHRGIIILCSVFLLCTVTLLNKNITEKYRTLLKFSVVAIVVATVVWSVVLGSEMSVNQDHQGWDADFSSKAWNNLYQHFSVVIPKNVIKGI